MKQLLLQKACVLALAVAPIWQRFLLPNHSKVWAEFQLFLQMIKAIYTYLLANIIEICATPVTNGGEKICLHVSNVVLTEIPYSLRSLSLTSCSQDPEENSFGSLADRFVTTSYSTSSQ